VTPAPHPQVTPLQLDVLRALWQLGEATSSEVQGALAPQRKLAPTTVATLLRRLEARGLATHTDRGRTHVYRAVVDETSLAGEQLVEVTERVFQGDLPGLVAQLLSTHEVAPGDLARIRALIEARERELAEDGTAERCEDPSD
jgi:BlaI family penicillinase repressor